MTSKFCRYFFIVLLFLSACHSRKNDWLDLTELTSVIKIPDADTIDPGWKKDNLIVYHIISEPDNLHPTNGNSSPRSEIVLYTQQYLLNVDFINQTVQPGLAKHLPVVGKDGLEYTYELRDEPSWDDGKQLEVDDIIFSCKANKCQLTNNPVTKGYWKNLLTIRKDESNPRRFTMVMKKKSVENTAFLTSFVMMERTFHDPENILSNYSFEQLDDTTFHADSDKNLVRWAAEFNLDKYGRDPEFLNGIGPYKVEKWEPGQYITIVRKKNYWANGSSEVYSEARAEKIIFRLNKDENSVQLEFKTQTYDASTYITTSTLLSLASNEECRKNYHVAFSPTYNYTYVAFNEKPDGVARKKLFTDSLTRRALTLMTPVDQIIQLIYSSYSSQCRRMVSNVSPIKKEFNKSLVAQPFDPELGRKLLKQAGWIDSDGDGTLDKMIDGVKTPFNCELYFLNTSTDWKDIASLIAAEFGKSGIQVNPVAMELKLLSGKGKAHDFDMIMGSWGATSLPEDYEQLWHSNSWRDHSSNYTGFGNSETDLLIDSIRTELDESKRISMINRLQQAIYDNQPYIFLYANLRRNIIHKRFGNILLFADRPGILLNTLKVLSTNNGITMLEETSP